MTLMVIQTKEHVMSTNPHNQWSPEDFLSGFRIFKVTVLLMDFFIVCYNHENKFAYQIRPI